MPVGARVLGHAFNARNSKQKEFHPSNARGTRLTRATIADFKIKWGVNTVPQLILNDTLIGGYNDVLHILRDLF